MIPPPLPFDERTRIPGPPGATCSLITRNQSPDAVRARRRKRLRARPPWTFVPNAVPEPPKRTVPKSHKGYAA